jgi:hypothetical protein
MCPLDVITTNTLNTPSQRQSSEIVKKSRSRREFEINFLIEYEIGFEIGYEMGRLKMRNACLMRGLRLGFAPSLIANLLSITEAELALQIQALGSLI